MSRVCLSAVVLLLFPLTVAAETPNIEPGEWEYTNHMSYSGEGMTLPDQTHSHRECVTLEDLQQGDAFMEDTGECEVLDMEIRRSGMTYSMHCAHEEGMEMRMNARMNFNGNRMDGTVDADMQMPIGEMEMHIKVEGQRVGDC